MTKLLVERELEDLVLNRIHKRVRESKRSGKAIGRTDIVSWAEANFYLPETEQPIAFQPFQRAVLKYSFDRLRSDDPRTDLFPSLRNREGYLPFRLIIFSTVKKSGKTTLGAVVGRWVAEDQCRFGEIYTTGNDQRQARERSFERIGESIRLTPGFVYKGKDGVLPDRWIVQSNKFICLSSGSKVEAISVDARGEAGSNPDLTLWTELWGMEYVDAVKFFHEMTPPPTKPDSVRLIETYAGFDGESLLLRSHYDLGKAGRQLTAGELSEATGEPLGCFAESPNPDDLVPIWINESAGMFMYWDSGLQARRMPWQKGIEGRKYYAEEEQKLPPQQFHRLHLNEWVGGESDFIPRGAWERCYDPNLPSLEPGDRTPAVLAVDAATTGDCFGIVLVTRHPKRHEDPAIRACRLWDPKEHGGKIDYDEPEAFIRTLVHGGCIRGHPQYPPFRKSSEECEHAKKAYGCGNCCDACRDNNLVPPYNIIEIAYDQYQLESMMGRLYKEAINTQAFSQQQQRMVADSMLYDLIITKRLAHNGDPLLKEHIVNCAAKMSKEEDTKLRIVKKAQGRKIDLAVAMSMGCRRILYLLI